MPGPLIAVVGDTNPARTFSPALKDGTIAKKAAEELGAELARRGARLLVYGGPFVEADVVRGFVSANPAADHSILMWYTKDQEPPPFAEEKTHPKLFQRRGQRGAEWEIAFYRSITKADGVILIGGANSTKISGQVAIGSRMPILTLASFGGAAASVWETLSAGEDLPTRDEIDLMARPWSEGSAAECVKALLAQHSRRRSSDTAPRPLLSFLAAVLFLAALAIVPWVWGQNAFAVWMLFLAPLLAGGAGGAIRPLIDHARRTSVVAPAVLGTVVLGLIAGGIAGVLFVTAQLTAQPELAVTGDVAKYAQRSIPFAVAVGFGAGFTSDAVFGKLLGLDVVRVTGIEAGSARNTQ
jgi:hypothetical protein